MSDHQIFFSSSEKHYSHKLYHNSHVYSSWFVQILFLAFYTVYVKGLIKDLSWNLCETKNQRRILPIMILDCVNLHINCKHCKSVISTSEYYVLILFSRNYLNFWSESTIHWTFLVWMSYFRLIKMKRENFPFEGL